MIIIGGIILIWVIAAICIHKGGIILTIVSFVVAMVIMLVGIGTLLRRSPTTEDVVQDTKDYITKPWTRKS